MMASLTSISSPHTRQRYRYSSGGGPKGSSSPSCGSGSWGLRRILPSPYGLRFIMDDTIARMPDPPHAHLTLAVRTAQGVTPGALLIALSCIWLEREKQIVLRVNRLIRVGDAVDGDTRPPSAPLCVMPRDALA